MQRKTTTKKKQHVIKSLLHVHCHVNYQAYSARQSIFALGPKGDSGHIIISKYLPSLVNLKVQYIISLENDIIWLENVQRRASRLVDSVKHLGHADGLQALGLPTLEYRRERADNVDQDKFFYNVSK